MIAFLASPRASYVTGATVAADGGRQSGLVRGITDQEVTMRAAVFNEPRSIGVGDRPDPAIAEPTDAVVRVVLACVCGSDLWYYRGESPFEPGPDRPRVHRRRRGRRCRGPQRRQGRPRDRSVRVQRRHLPALPPRDHDACVAGGFFPINGDGGQGEAVRVPLADGTLVTVPGTGPLGRDARLSADALRRDVHRPPRGGVRRRKARRHRRGRRRRRRRAVRSARRASASARTRSSRSAVTPTGRSSRASSVPPTSSRSAARRPPRPSWR